jgi:hypothetical protein
LRMYTGTLEKSVPVTLWTVHKNSLWTITGPQQKLLEGEIEKNDLTLQMIYFIGIDIHWW